MERTAYANMGITTIRGAWLLLVTFISLAVLVVASHTIRTHNYEAASIAAIWLVGVTIGHIRFLREFEALNLDPTSPTTRFVFKILTMVPVYGIVPVILLLMG